MSRRRDKERRPDVEAAAIVERDAKRSDARARGRVADSWHTVARAKVWVDEAVSEAASARGSGTP